MPHPATAPPLDAPIPVEPGYHDRVAAACIRQALAAARDGSPGAAARLDHTGADWAESLAPSKGGPLVRDVLAELERRGESAYRRLMRGGI